MSNHPEGLVSFQGSADYDEGEPVRCPHLRRNSHLPCNGRLAVVPTGTSFLVRPIRANHEAQPGTVSIRCHSCKGLTEIRPSELAQASRVVAAAPLKHEVTI